MADEGITNPTPGEAPQDVGGPPTLAESMERVATAADADPTAPTAESGSDGHATPTQAVIPAPPLTLSADLDVKDIEDLDVLRSLFRQAQTLAFMPPAPPPAPPVKPEHPAPAPDAQIEPLGVFDAHALQMLGAGTPPELVTQFAAETAKLESARPHLESADENYAKAAKAAFAVARERLMLLKIQADHHHIAAELRSSKQPQVEPAASVAVVERTVLAKLARPGLVESIPELPYLAAAIKAGKYDPAWLAEGLDFSLPVDALNAAIDAVAVRANRDQSRHTFGAPKSPSPNTPHQPAGARVDNPAAFAARPDEPPPPPKPSGPSTMSQSLMRINAARGQDR